MANLLEALRKLAIPSVGTEPLMSAPHAGLFKCPPVSHSGPLGDGAVIYIAI